MPSAELERLVNTNLLAREAPIRAEIEGLITDAALTLADAQIETLSLESRFRLAYGAVHSIALAALRWHGYRPRNNRQVVFQALAHTLKVPAQSGECSRVLTSSATDATTKASVRSTSACCET